MAIIVSPDSVEVNEQIIPPSVHLNVEIRNTNTFMIAVSPCAPDVEQETAADVWENVRPENDCFLEPMPAGTQRFFVAFIGPMPPGHYRLRSSYAVADRNGVSAMGRPTLSQFSNAFVVLP